MRLLRNTSRDSGNSAHVDRRRDLPRPIMVLKANAHQNSKTFFGYAKNISRSGMMIGATNPREPGSRFRLEIPLPEPLDVVVTCICEVVWNRRWAKNGCHEPGMGLRFLDLSPEIADTIDDWIERENLIAQLSA